MTTNPAPRQSPRSAKSKRSLRLWSSLLAFTAVVTPAQNVTPSTLVRSTTKALQFNNQTFTKNEEDFDPDTKVWSVFFDLKGATPGTGDQGVIFNFYGWNPPVSPQSIAEAFVNKNPTIFKFQAPDDVTKATAYFIYSENFHVDKHYGYANITKISSIGTSTYAVSYGRRIEGRDETDIDRNIKAWLLTDDAKGVQKSIGQIAVDKDWQQHFAKSK